MIAPAHGTLHRAHLGPGGVIVAAIGAVAGAGVAAAIAAAVQRPTLLTLAAPVLALPALALRIGSWTAAAGAGAGASLFGQLGAIVVAGVLARLALQRTRLGTRGVERVRQLINRLVLWVTLPALVYQTVHGAPLGAEVLQALATAVAGMAVTATLAWWLLVRLFGRTPQTAGLVLAASVGSVSFFGIPIVRSLFAPGEARVAVYFAVLNVPLALLAAALLRARLDRAAAVRPAGRPSLTAFVRQALGQFVAVPATWALLAALGLRSQEPPPLAGAGIHGAALTVAPTVMFALGLGLRFERRLAPYRMAAPAVAIKLALSPLIILAAARLLGLTGLPLVVLGVQGAMPTQVLGIVIAERYRLDARLVGLTLALDTALAFVVLPLLIGAIHTLVLGPAL